MKQAHPDQPSQPAKPDRSVRPLMETIERIVPEGGSWCDLEKASRLAAMIVALRPSTVVEIGVWIGGSLVPMALALKYNGHGKAIAIDPWSAEASCANEEPANVAWWGKVDHQGAYAKFRERLRQLELDPFVEVRRMTSDQSMPPQTIDLLHVDGSHTEQAIRDVQRYGRNVRIGGIMILDDLNWSSGAVLKAHDLGKKLGFVDLYPLGSGVVMQRMDPEE